MFWVPTLAVKCHPILPIPSLVSSFLSTVLNLLHAKLKSAKNILIISQNSLSKHWFPFLLLITNFSMQIQIFADKLFIYFIFMHFRCLVVENRIGVRRKTQHRDWSKMESRQGPKMVSFPQITKTPSPSIKVQFSSNLSSRKIIIGEN